MVPELLVTDLPRSLAFWMDLCGFKIAYRREAEGFVYLDLDGAQFMLEEVRGDNYWITGPLGVRQFLVQDPDGYLLRFSARIGMRAA